MPSSAYDQISSSLEIGTVYYFTDKDLSSPEPHYHVVIKRNPQDEGVIYLVIATSQVKKKIGITAALGFPPETLVTVESSEYPLFKKQTVFDCNTVIDKSIQSLSDKLKNGKLKICEPKMPDYIIENLIQGILASFTVSTEIQDMLRS